ncbi:hypothetical protein GALMADRAFT_246087 [Galerina marginata CBS 339.88]|uniref:GST N-terminal domain-containing protein n=1 Tax=Galerina marginata (strain CBS 339.88) TaxID=685588 RepID=A0A067T3T1_GALM3|nr:hypothetical protein GALMADRAFT_246087 [Galerina marginata CBS 339.88]
MSQPPYTVIGTPFSTFTRTITLGLQYKGLKYTQLATPPQSQLALESHPFGYLPTLIIHEIDGKKVDVKLRESQAIVRYIDRIAPEPSLHLQPGDAVVEEKMWEFVSLTASFGFPIVEGLVVKPRVKAMDSGKLSDEEVQEKIKDGVVELRRFLALAESLMAPSGYAFGERLTWADFFLYPILADLRMVPEWEVVSERLVDWKKKMDELDAAKATTPGTLSVGGRP